MTRIDKVLQDKSAEELRELAKELIIQRDCPGCIKNADCPYFPISCEECWNIEEE